MNRSLILLLALGLVSGCLGPLGLPAPDVSISPAAPGPEDDLVLVLEELPSDEGRPVITFQIQWQQDGVTVDELAGAVLVASSWTVVDETWTATVAALQGTQVGPASQASVVIAASGDDDDDVSPGVPGTAGRLCAAAGTVSNGVYTVTPCTGPVEAAPGVVTNGIYTIRINKLAPLAL